MLCNNSFKYFFVFVFEMSYQMEKHFFFLNEKHLGSVHFVFFFNFGINDCICQKFFLYKV